MLQTVCIMTCLLILRGVILPFGFSVRLSPGSSWDSTAANMGVQPAYEQPFWSPWQLVLQ